MRKFEFQTGEYYHIYNRGVDGRNIFLDEKDYLRFLQSMREFNITEPIGSLYIKNKQEKQSETQRGSTPLRGVVENRKALRAHAGLLEPGEESGKVLEPDNFVVSECFVKFICYCLNPTHYHFLLKQSAKNGISKFMHKLGMGYTNYFNSKYNRSGALFQGTYKAIHIKSDSYLLWLSGYINGNAEIHRIARTENWIWGSYLDYIGKRGGVLCDKKVILSQFRNVNEYRDLVDVIIRESSQGKEELKKYLLE